MEPIQKSVLPFTAGTAALPMPNDRRDMSESAKLESAAAPFETMLALQLVQSMQKTLENGSLFGSSHAGQMYGSLGEWDLARLLSQSAHFGLKEQLLQQLQHDESTHDSTTQRFSPQTRLLENPHSTSE
jgi:Rod binding domain-containing protein